MVASILYIYRHEIKIVGTMQSFTMYKFMKNQNKSFLNCEKSDDLL